MTTGGRQVVAADELRQLSQNYQRRSQEVAELTRTLTNQITGAMWDSAAATNFRGDWSSKYSPTLTNLSDVLDQLSRELNQRAQIADELNRR